MSRTIRARVALTTLASLGLAISCNENLPIGPNTFVGATVRIVWPRDTIVVGDTSQATAEVVDAQGNKVQGLKFNWATSDANVLSVANAGTDSSGRAKALIGLRPGRSNVSLSLPDPRFATQDAARPTTVVVGAVRVLTTRDTTLTAVNDTAMAIAAGLVRLNGTLITRTSLGIKWRQIGNRTSIVGQGDTIRYIARAGGADTLIASHDFCLATAKCADTIIVRVAQVVTLGLSDRNFQAWSFSDTVGPSVVLTDRRGNGLPGATIRFIPRTANDSARVRVTAVTGTTNPVNGVMAAPKVFATGNGTARVRVQAMAADGVTPVATDSVTVVVRQVARRVAVEPLRATISGIDSIPMLTVARDARGYPILDATVTYMPNGVITQELLDWLWAGPSPVPNAATGFISPTLAGNSLPSLNPDAPQVAVTSHSAAISLIAPDSVIAADTTTVALTFTVIDSVGQLAAGRWVRFRASAGVTPDSVEVDALGRAHVVWIPPKVAGKYTLTGIRGTTAPMSSVADSAGRIVLRRSTLVYSNVADKATTIVSISTNPIVQGTTATITIVVKDRYGNLVKKIAPSVTLTQSGGSIGPQTCVAATGTCTATYTAPGAPGTQTISAMIGADHVVGSPMTVTISP